MKKLLWVCIASIMALALAGCRSGYNRIYSNSFSSSSLSSASSNQSSSTSNNVSSNQSSDASSSLFSSVSSLASSSIDVAAFKNSHNAKEPFSYTAVIDYQLLFEDIKVIVGSLVEGDVAAVNHVASLLRGHFDESSQVVLVPAGCVAGNNLLGTIADGYSRDNSDGSDCRPVNLIQGVVAQLKAQVGDGIVDSVVIAGNPITIPTWINKNGVDYQHLLHALLVVRGSWSQMGHHFFLQDFESQIGLNAPSFNLLERNFAQAINYLLVPPYFWSSLDAGLHSPQNHLNCEQLLAVTTEEYFAQIAACAKQHSGSISNTYYAYLAVNHLIHARKILALAVAAGGFNVQDKVEFEAHLKDAALALEKSIAAKVIHSINAVHQNLEESKSVGGFETLADFTSLAKNWSEMKGFALGLQANPPSLFYDSPSKKDALNTMFLSLGVAPVLADETQDGTFYSGGISQYQRVLMDARDLLQATYAFTSEEAATW